METLLIQITDQKARKLLDDLADLHLIRVLKTSDTAGESSRASRFSGKLALSDEVYNQFQAYIE